MCTSKGKRKAHFESGLSLLSKEKVNDKDVRSTGLGHDSLEEVGQFTYGTLKAKPNSNSVKGKKDFARSRATHLNLSQSSRTRENKNPNTQWTLGIATIQSGKNGGFTFGNNPGNEMDDQRGQ